MKWRQYCSLKHWCMSFKVCCVTSHKTVIFIVTTRASHHTFFVACVKYMLCFLSVQDSFASAIIPLKDDVSLQEKYVTFKGYVRLGRLLEDMDIFAGEYKVVMCVQLKKCRLPVVSNKGKDKVVPTHKLRCTGGLEI